MWIEKLSWKAFVLTSEARLSEGTGVELRAEGNSLRISFRNLSDKAVKLKEFRFEANRMQLQGRGLRVYCEGWTMPAVAASRKYGDTDFFIDPGYRQFAVVDANDYRCDEPNCFQAENAVVLNDQETGDSLLAGFVTTADYYNRFRIRLTEAGVEELTAVVYGDGREVAPGEEVLSEELAIWTGADAYGLLEQYASALGKRMQARVPAGKIPTGWCSWYYYFFRVTESDVLENLEWLRGHREELPLEYFQIDDGYQPTPGDWLLPSERFPKGPEYILRKIAEAGFKPGLWVAPFMVCSDSQLFKAHPEFLIHNAEGEILFPIKWRGVEAAILDCSRDDVCAWLRDLFATLKQWGCTYAKLDFLMYESCVAGGVYHNPQCTRAQALRRGLQAIRSGTGEDMFILGCSHILGPAVGIVDGGRIGTDITPRWRREDKPGAEAPSVPNVCRNIINRRYMHRKLWLNDPDVLIVREDNISLTEAERRLWFTAIWLVGGMLLLSDRFSTLSPEQIQLIKTQLTKPEAFESVRPIDFLDREAPAIWFGIRKQDGRPAIGLFNFGEKSLPLSVDLGKLKVADYSIWQEYWTHDELHSVEGCLNAELKPHSAMLLFPK